MSSKAEEQRAEEQLRRLIGDAAYTDWEEKGRIGINVKSKWFPGQWVIRRVRRQSLYLYYRGEYQCVRAAWGFKGPVPLADQVIALCLWIYGDEDAVLGRAFPTVELSVYGRARAEDWDAIIREA